MAEDIIEEALNLFRPNIFAKSFDIRGPADRTLVYLLLYIGDCLCRIKPETSLVEAQRTLANVSAQSFALPGEAGFPLNGMFPPAEDAEALRNYLSGLRSETATRLLARLYPDGATSSKPSILWISYQKRKFMNKSL